MIRTRTIVIVMVATFSTVLPLPAQFDHDAEQLVLSQLNAAREQHGLSPLKANEQLQHAARQHSIVMAQQHKLSHGFSGEPNLQQRLANAGAYFSRSGENVGYNTDESDIHAAFMRSPPHRANILTPEYNSVGIGIVHQGRDYWVTEDFATSVESLSTSQAESEAAAAIQQLRRQQHLPPMKVEPMPQLHNTVCKMAKQGNMSNKELVQFPKVRYAITYTNAQPQVLPKELKTVVSQSNLGAFSVGSCFVQNERNPGGIYWTAVLFF